MAKTDSEQQGWHGLGFLRDLMIATRSKTTQVNVLYAPEYIDGSIGDTYPRLVEALASRTEELSKLKPAMWIARPKWYKELGVWKSKAPAKNESDRWFRIETRRCCLAVTGNLISGPKGNCSLPLTPTFRQLLRSGNFNKKLLRKLDTLVQSEDLHLPKTFKDIERLVGIHLLDKCLRLQENEPVKLMIHSIAVAGLWSVINHVANDMRNTEDQPGLRALRNAFRDGLDPDNIIPSVRDALAASMNHLTANKNFSPQLRPLMKKSREHLDRFVVDIFFKVSPDVQKVFALEGRHRMRASAERKILGGKVNTTLTKPNSETALAVLPPFNTKRKREWLDNHRKLEHMIYHSARQANTLPDDMRKGRIGFRVGGQGGQRSVPGVGQDGSITMFLTPMLALADAVRRGETSTILWCARFSKYDHSLHTGTISGIPKQGLTYIDIKEILTTSAYRASQYLYQSAYDQATPELKEKLSVISLTLTFTASQPTYKAKLLSLVEECLKHKITQPMRDYLRIARESANPNPNHAAFWPMSIVIEHVGSETFNPKLRHLMAGSTLHDILSACNSAKKRRWEMYAWLEDNYTAAIYSLAVVTALKVMHQRGAEVSQ